MISDTLTSIGVDEACDLGIYLIPQIILFGEDCYKGDTEIDSSTFIKRLKSSSILPKTTAPNPTFNHPILQSLIDSEDEVFIICPN